MHWKEHAYAEVSIFVGTLVKTTYLLSCKADLFTHSQTPQRKGQKGQIEAIKPMIFYKKVTSEVLSGTVHLLEGDHSIPCLFLCHQQQFGIHIRRGKPVSTLLLLSTQVSWIEIPDTALPAQTMGRFCVVRRFYKPLILQNRNHYLKFCFILKEIKFKCKTFRYKSTHAHTHTQVTAGKTHHFLFSMEYLE